MEVIEITYRAPVRYPSWSWDKEFEKQSKQQRENWARIWYGDLAKTRRATASFVLPPILFTAQQAKPNVEQS